MSKDWTGNQNSIYKTLGASSHTDRERQVDDYYATDPKALELLLQRETFSENIWECACGEGHLSETLKKHGYNVRSSDIVNRGYDSEIIDFLKYPATTSSCDIITNPPYKYALEFCDKALSLVESGHKVAMFLKLQFLEGQKRFQFFEKYPPKEIYVFSSRMKCAMNGDFDSIKSSAVAYAWFIWQKDYIADPVIKWIK